MASTYSDLKFELIGTGDQSGTWGTTTNDNIGTAIEQAITGFGNPVFTTDANLTISLTNTVALQTARALVLNATSSGSLTATRELVVPTIEKQYIVQNNTTGGQSITVKTSAGTGITVTNGRKAHLYVDGTNVIQMFDFVDINGGAIDGTTVGAASASTGAFTTLNASGATTLDGTVALGNASGDLITVPGTVNSNLIFTDNSFDIGASGATRPRNLFLAGAATVGGNLSVGGTLTLTGGVNLNGNVTVGATGAGQTARLNVNGGNTAGSGIDSIDVNATLAAFNGSDNYTGLKINITNANHTGSSDTVYGIDIPGISFDADETAAAIHVGNTGWNYAMQISSGIGINFGGIDVVDSSGALSIGAPINVGGGADFSGSISVNVGSGFGTMKTSGSTGGCFMIRDTDGVNWTKCKSLAGVLICSADADGECD